jgi:ABC-type lipoprotein export system ATPase subunit
MKSRLHRLEIRNFKAFREFTLNLEGRHLLVYGSNGSGKSSLYWALYTFLQSARKPKNSIAKYFDPAGQENLLNIHEQKETTPKLGEIALTLRDTATNNDTTYRISHTDHGTFQQPAILKGDLASDFITYRFFFGFSHFRNSEKFNLWPLFEKEILPSCVSTGTGNLTPLDMWNQIKSGNPNPMAYSGYAGSDAYSDFQRNTDSFAAILPGIINSISTEAQSFYDKNFASGDPTPVTLKLGVTTPPSFSGTNQQTSDFKVPVIELHLQIDGKTITRPQSFLNEAKLTQLALSVRFAASRINLHESDLKLLVLDDLLVSLDMSNRMKVVGILLSDTFANYQKIILTHDRGFFEEFRRMIGTTHTEWCFRTLQGNPKDGIKDKDEKTLIKQQRENLKHFMSQDAWKTLEAIEVLDAVIQMKDRVLNPAAHWAETPLYNAEVKKALTLIGRLEATLLK